MFLVLEEEEAARSVCSSVDRLEKSLHQVPGEVIKENNSSFEVQKVCGGWECGVSAVQRSGKSG